MLYGVVQSEWATSLARIDAGERNVPQFCRREVEARAGFTAAALSTNDVVLVLDTEVTPELEQEGTARDFVRLVRHGAQGRRSARQRPH